MTSIGQGFAEVSPWFRRGIRRCEMHLRCPRAP